MVYYNFHSYVPADDGVLGVVYLRDSNNVDWYEAQKGFNNETLKICFDSKGVIRAFDSDVSRLFPDKLSVTEISTKDVPDGLNITGGWRWDGVAVVPVAALVKENQKRTKAEIMADIEKLRAEIEAQPE
ncbi:TPA: hypothetical protein L9L56_004489 [Klebsiella pneumoniae]|uniref:hypothetical protein n=1 Tax=Klebsiella pneumoniae TaxID=573 RepID=UPI000E2E823B|nr:hypothetical protein [Klebsiella pneumoniae]HBR1366665.1 hypothetical protein [Klebsiella pneumoniae]HBR2015008.1 hypothetical protein [Klebsiella pneumoniae]